jgi:hypothetical protein
MKTIQINGSRFEILKAKITQRMKVLERSDGRQIQFPEPYTAQLKVKLNGKRLELGHDIKPCRLLDSKSYFICGIKKARYSGGIKWATVLAREYV